MNADSALAWVSMEKKRVEGHDKPVVVVFSTEDVNVQCCSRGDGEGVENVGDHFRREFAYLFSFKAELCNTERS